MTFWQRMAPPHIGLLLMACGAVGQTTAPARDTVLRVETNVVLVDAVVTDKKGNYVRDLTQKNFKVWEDNKEQTITSFSFGADPASPLHSQPRYLVLYFDNSSMSVTDQTEARKAAVSFIDANAGPNRLMAVVNFSGHLQIAQNFTADVDRLKAIAGGAKIPAGPSTNGFELARAAGDFGARNSILGIRALAKSLADVPGRKTLVLLTAGLPLSQGNLPEVTATIDTCNRSNVAIYPIDVRGLVGGSAAVDDKSLFKTVAFQKKGLGNDPEGILDPPPATTRGLRGSPRMMAPKIPEAASKNQQVMYMLAEGTGGFVIVNTNDLLSGMQKITKELNEFYLIGYTPPAAEDGTVGCHTIRVKVDRGGTAVRARTGYCTAKMQDVLAKTPVEAKLESHADATQAGDIAATMQTPFFYTGSNVARVNVAMEIPGRSLKFAKEKGKLRSAVNILGIAYNKDGTVAARFSDVAKIDFDTQKQVEEFQQGIYHYEKEFKIASGEYNLKVVFGAGGESFGKIEQPLVVDAYDVKTFSVSALAWSVQFQKAADADPGMALLDERTPLVAGGFQLTPAGLAKFKKAETVGMYFEIYEPGLLEAEPPKSLEVGVEVRAFDAKGAVKFDTGTLRVATPETGGNPSVPFAVAIPAGTLEPGAYTVEVTAMDSLSNKFKRSGTIEVR